MNEHCKKYSFKMEVDFREEVEEFFDSMDRDFDGRLTFEEFMGEESTIEKLFKNMDRNGDGVVTKQVGVTLNNICLA